MFAKFVIFVSKAAVSVPSQPRNFSTILAEGPVSKVTTLAVRHGKGVKGRSKGASRRVTVAKGRGKGRGRKAGSR